MVAALAVSVEESIALPDIWGSNLGAAWDYEDKEKMTGKKPPSELRAKACNV
jgi:hypothetical protein